ncbi:uncharacterized protein LOC133532419 isoform X2 [Cydia pomonella]|uniref:uncharacterized protein LOC133532419 isoform X2 n=1 Tax=Cydia pomonella TaxID=82600 RepID=UPI002ADE3640|nr:uncharacterized protein LOC133532419 isoform X2 [Cydia pomonella]
MYGVFIAYIFSLCLFLSRSELNYTIFRSADDHHLKLKFDGSIELSGSDEQNIVSDKIDRLPFLGGINDVQYDNAVSDRDSDIMSEKGTEVRTADIYEIQDSSIDGSAEMSELMRENSNLFESVRIEDTDSLDENNREFTNNYGSAEKSSSEGESNGSPQTGPQWLRAESNETSDSIEYQMYGGGLKNSALGGTSNEPLRAGVNETSDISVAQDNGVDSPSDRYLQLFGNEDKQKNVTNSVFVPTDYSLRLTTRATSQSTTKFKRHKVQDDDRIRKFTAHVYEQALKVFEAMKKKTDQYTAKKIDSLAETYKQKFTEFVKNTRNVDIKTRQGTQNVILHTIDTSNLILERIVNFLKTDMLGEGTSALRQGGASRLQKEVDTVKSLEHEHACKMFGICHSANGFRFKLQNIISTLISLPDNKLLQANDAATEILKDADLSAFISSYVTLNRVEKAIRSLEKADAITLRKNLEVLFGVLSLSHLPLIVDKGKTFEKRSVKRTVAFHGLLDALEDALPPTEANKSEWGDILNRLKIWKDGGVSDVQETLKMLFDHVNRGAQKYREKSEKIRELVEDVAESC